MNRIRHSFKGKKELIYHKNSNGRIITTLSPGWDPKEVALELSLDFWEEKLKIITDKCQANKLSPLAYYLVLNKMTLKILSQHIKIPQWQLWLGLKPFFFTKFSNKSLSKIAFFFKISVTDFKPFVAKNSKINEF